MEKKIIIVGGGGHAKVLLDILKMNNANILGFVDIKETDFPEEYLGKDEALSDQYSPQDIALVNGVGSVKRPEQRQKVFEYFKSLKYEFVPVVHPRATISESAEVGEGVQIMANAVVNPGSVVEDNAIVNTSASIDHDCKIGAHSHIAPGVTLSGNVHVGVGCHLGTGTTVIQGITIGDRVLIGAGEVVRKDVTNGKRVLTR
ncbi:MAG: acetyltransferase [Candidatus Omnitrophica bacterium]|nr:acetyltransferase [Candidatus Omnitrophota bacterium]